ncbi:MAG: hypothetical protein Q9191_002084 [Dirinaria sp. TL-2023a]
MSAAQGHKERWRGKKSPKARNGETLSINGRVNLAMNSVFPPTRAQAFGRRQQPLNENKTVHSIEKSPTPTQGQPAPENLLNGSHRKTRHQGPGGNAPSTLPDLCSTDSDLACERELSSPVMTDQSPTLASSPIKAERQDDVVIRRNRSPTSSIQVVEQLERFVSQQPQGKATIGRIKRFLRDERLEISGVLEVDEYEYISSIMSNLFVTLGKKKFSRVVRHMGIGQYFSPFSRRAGYVAPRPRSQDFPEPSCRAFTEPPPRRPSGPPGGDSTRPHHSIGFQNRREDFPKNVIDLTNQKGKQVVRANDIPALHLDTHAHSWTSRSPKMPKKKSHRPQRFRISRSNSGSKPEKGAGVASASPQSQSVDAGDRHASYAPSIGGRTMENPVNSTLTSLSSTSQNAPNALKSSDANMNATHVRKQGAEEDVDAPIQTASGKDVRRVEHGQDRIRDPYLGSKRRRPNFEIRVPKQSKPTISPSTGISVRGSGPQTASVAGAQSLDVVINTQSLKSPKKRGGFDHRPGMRDVSMLQDREVHLSVGCECTQLPSSSATATALQADSSESYGAWMSGALSPPSSLSQPRHTERMMSSIFPSTFYGRKHTSANQELPHLKSLPKSRKKMKPKEAKCDKAPPSTQPASSSSYSSPLPESLSENSDGSASRESVNGSNFAGHQHALAEQSATATLFCKPSREVDRLERSEIASSALINRSDIPAGMVYMGIDDDENAVYETENVEATDDATYVEESSSERTDSSDGLSSLPPTPKPAAEIGSQDSPGNSSLPPSSGPQANLKNSRLMTSTRPLQLVSVDLPVSYPNQRSVAGQSDSRPGGRENADRSGIFNGCPDLARLVTETVRREIAARGAEQQGYHVDLYKKWDRIIYIARRFGGRKRYGAAPDIFTTHGKFRKDCDPRLITYIQEREVFEEEELDRLL